MFYWFHKNVNSSLSVFCIVALVRIIQTQISIVVVVSAGLWPSNRQSSADSVWLYVYSLIILSCCHSETLFWYWWVLIQTLIVRMTAKFWKMSFGKYDAQHMLICNKSYNFSCSVVCSCWCQLWNYPWGLCPSSQWYHCRKL